MLRMLGNKNFSLYFFGRLFSNIAQYSVLFLGALYIVDTLGKASYQGLFSSFVVLLQVIAYPLAIVLTKTWKKIRVLFITDYLSAGILIGGGFVLFSMKDASPELRIAILAVLSGLVAINVTFFNSSASGVLPYVVEDKDYAKAQSMISFILTMSSVLGLIVSGVLYELFGVELTLMIMGTLYFVSAVTEMFINLENEEIHEKNSTRNPFKLYGRSLVDSTKLFFSKSAGTRMLYSLLLSAIFISGYHQIVSPFFIKTYLGLTGEEGTFWLTIFKGMTMLGSMVGALLLPSLVKKKFGHASIKVGIFLELFFQVVWAVTVTIFDKGYLDTYTTLILASSTMLIRTMFGNIRFAAGRIGMDNCIAKKDIMVYNTNFRFMFSIVEVPTFLLLGFMLDIYGMAFVLFLIAATSLTLRILSWFIIKNVKYIRGDDAEDALSPGTKSLEVKKVV